MSEDTPKLFSATLKEGQTYHYSGRRFEFGVAETVDLATYQALRKEAIKSVKQGDGGTVKRVTIQMFEFKKVKLIPASEAPAPEPDDEEADEIDMMDEVTMVEGREGTDGGEGGDGTGASTGGDNSSGQGGERAPASRSRARGATGAA